MIKECIKNKESPPNKPVMPCSLSQGSTGSTVEVIYLNLFFDTRSQQKKAIEIRELSLHLLGR